MGKLKDLTGQRFGRLVVLGRAENKIQPNGNSVTRWNCLCDCGNEKIIEGRNLTNGLIKSCGCLHKETAKLQGKSCLIDLTGQKFDRLTVIKREEDYISPKGERQVRWLCKCDCGNEIIVRSNSLRKGNTKSCGCLQKEKASKANKKYNTYDLSGEYGIGYTSKGEEFYFDLEDYNKIKDYCWFLDKEKYVVSSNYKNGKNNNIKMHRLIMNCKDSNIFIDHINHNVYDNRKYNLRIVAPSQNNYNKGIQPYNTSGIIGVYYNNRKKKWVANICVNGKNHSVYCETIDEAKNERLKLENKYFGEYSYNNSVNVALTSMRGR